MLNVAGMKTAELIRLFGGVTRTAEVFGVTKSAVSQWGDEVPPLRVYQLRERRPSIDDELAVMRAQHSQAA